MAANPAKLGPKAARWQCVGPGCAAARAAGGRALLDADSCCCICKAPRPRAADPGALILQHRALLSLPMASPHSCDPQSPGTGTFGVEHRAALAHSGSLVPYAGIQAGVNPGERRAL